MADRGRGRGGGPGTQAVPIFRQSGDLAPDQEAAKIEADLDLNIKASKLSTSAPIHHASMPLRPGHGVIGRPVTLYANHFELKSKLNTRLYRYAIELQTKPPSKKLRRVVQQLIDEHLAEHQSQIATDYRAWLICTTDLDIAFKDFHVRYYAEDEDGPCDNAEKYTVRLYRKDSPTFGDLLNYLSCTDPKASFDFKAEVIQALNIIIGHHPKTQKQISSIGANRHYDTTTPETYNLGSGLHAIRGYFVSVRPATARLLVNSQVKSAAFFNEGPLEELMLCFLDANGQNRYKLAMFLERLSVQVTHIVKKNKKGLEIKRFKTIAGLAMLGDGGSRRNSPRVRTHGAGPDDVEFYLETSAISKGSTSGGQPEYLSLTRFFKKTYNIDITRKNLPVINVGSKEEPVYLPPQVCRVIAGQPCRRKLSPNQTKQMMDFAVRTPGANATAIVTTGAQMLGFEPTNSTLDTFDLNVATRLITVPGKVLQPPAVEYFGRKTVNARSGSWNMANTKFARSAPKSSWVYLRISYMRDRNPWKDQAGLDASIKAMSSEMQKCGLNNTCFLGGLNIVVDPSPDKQPQAEQLIAEAVRRFTANPSRPAPDMILGILPPDDKLAYNTLKYVCDIKEGILNVNVVAAKFAVAKAQYLANVALKINTKLGGQNQRLDKSKLGVIGEGKTMIVGIDVTHPAPDSKITAPSIAAVVASIDASLAQWPGELYIQPQARQEEVSGIENLFKSRLRLWQRFNKSYPENIIIYRDGVSEGQYDMVLTRELPNYRKACRELYPNGQMPRISIIVVGKRHHTRFYATSEQDGDRNGNPNSGTYVDRGVTEARNWDFYLQAHAAIKGTARPAHYYVVHDEIFQRLPVRAPFKSPADVLIDLTHNLCYMFTRATKAVSICPAAYYADLACDRARLYLHNLYDPSGAGSVSSVASLEDSIRIHPNVKDRMFYI